MISFILPFFKKVHLFQIAFPLNACFREPDVEVVCVLDDPSEEAGVMRFVRQHPEVKWKVIVNDREHEWRTPCVPYNVGIRHSVGTHCALFDAESILQLPRPSYLREVVNIDFRRSHAGFGWHVPNVEPNEPEDMLRRRLAAVEATYAPAYWGFGFLLAHRCELIQICGFDESRVDYGWDDDDVRIRLTRLGVITEIDPLIKIYHILHPNPYDRVEQKTPLKPHTVLVEQRDTWGMEFGRVAYDWEKKNEPNEPTDNSIQCS